MRRGRVFIYLALIIILGVVAAVVVVPKLGLFSSKKTPSTNGTPAGTPAPAPVTTVKVVYLSQNVTQGQKIEEIHLTYQEFPIANVNETMFTDFAQVVGQVARYPLVAPKILAKSDLAEGPVGLVGGSNDALLIPNGMVAVSVPITRLSSVSYAPRRGDHVNVIVTMMFIDLDQAYQSQLPNQTAAVISPGPAVLMGMGGGTRSQAGVGSSQQEMSINASLTTNENLRTVTAQIASGGYSSSIGRFVTDPAFPDSPGFYVVPAESQRPRIMSQTLIQNVTVLQMGNFSYEKTETVAVQADQPTPTPSAATVVTSVAPDVITLIVTPQDAVTLNWLIYNGAQLTLALRSPGDTSTGATEAVTMKFLLDRYGVVVPGKEAFGVQPRVDQLIPPTLRNDKIVTPTQP